MRASRITTTFVRFDLVVIVLPGLRTAVHTRKKKRGSRRMLNSSVRAAKPKPTKASKGKTPRMSKRSHALA